MAPRLDAMPRSDATRVKGARVAWLLVSFTLVLAIAACGGDSEDENPQLTVDDRRAVEHAQREIGAYCRHLAQFILRERPAPTPAETGEAVSAVDRLAAVAREKPYAEYRPGQRMRTLVGDTAEGLEGSNCTGPVLERLQQAHGSLPP